MGYVYPLQKREGIHFYYFYLSSKITKDPKNITKMD